MISEFRLIKFLFTGCLVRNQPENVLKMFLKFVSEILCIIHYQWFNHELWETWILSSHRTLFQANSDEICRLFNKTITLPSVLLSLVFDFCFIFCKYPCFSLILRWVRCAYFYRPPFWKTTHSQFFSFPVLRSQLENVLKPPKSHWVGSAWAVARRFVPLANRRAEKTIAIVFQIRLQLVRAKSSFQSPDRT